MSRKFLDSSFLVLSVCAILMIVCAKPVLASPELELLEASRKALGLTNEWTQVKSVMASGQFKQENRFGASSGSLRFGWIFPNQFNRIIDSYSPGWRITTSENITITNSWIDIRSNHGGHGKSGPGKIWKHHLDSPQVKESLEMDSLRLRIGLFLMTQVPDGVKIEFKEEKQFGSTNVAVYTATFSGAPLMDLFINKETSLPIRIRYQSFNPDIVTFIKNRKSTLVSVEANDVELSIYDYREVQSDGGKKILLPHRFTVRRINAVVDEWQINRYILK